MADPPCSPPRGAASVIAMGEYLDSRYSWSRLAVSVVIATVGNVGMWSFIVILPVVQAEFAVARGAAALPYTLTMVGFALGNLLIGRAVDRFGMTSALIGAAGVIAAGFVMAALAPTLWMLALAQGVIGFGTAAGFGPLIADISHWFARRRGIAVGLVASGNYLAGAIWPLVLTPLLAAHGWRVVYVGIALVAGGLVAPLALLIRRRIPAPLPGAAAAERLATLPFGPRGLTALLCLAGIGCCVAMSMPQVHIVSYCVDLGYGPAVGAEMLSLMLAGGVVSRLASGFLADHFGGVRTLLIGSCLQAMALVLYLPAGGMTSLYIVSLIFGLAQGGIVPAYAIIVREYLPAREAGARVGVVIMATIVGMALGGWMSGWIYDVTGSYRMAFLNGIVWNLLNIAVMVLLLRASGRRMALA